MPPSPENQIKFLVDLPAPTGRKLFVATYRYALLLPLADTSVEKGDDDSGAALTIARERSRRGSWPITGGRACPMLPGAVRASCRLMWSGSRKKHGRGHRERWLP